MTTFLHLSDSHIAGTVGERRHDRMPLDDLQRLITSIRRLHLRLDLAVHTGDLCAAERDDQHAPREAYGLALRGLQRLALPLYLAVGNHDLGSELVRLQAPPHPLLETGTTERLAYTFQARTFVGAVLDTTQGTAASGRLGPRQLEALRRLLARSPKRLAIFLHHPPIALGVDWLDSILLLEDGEELHDLLRRHARRVAGVFFGHIHSALQVQRDGVLYAAAGSTTYGFDVIPGSAPFRLDADAPAECNIVTITADQTLVQSLRIAAGRRP